MILRDFVSRTYFLAALAAVLAVPAVVLGEEASGVTIDPAKVVTYEACAKCHANEINVWHDTPHFRTFRTLHRQPEAQQIAERIGVQSIKRGDVCIRCHYTQQESNGRVKPVSGISCESCHGAAKDWLEVHSDYGGLNVTKETESAEHRDQRIRRSIALGMRNPANLYLVARSCLNCHTVPNEQLVNVGRHAPGSLDFELVSWSQGLVRHNFLRTNGTSNAESSADRLRLMYVVGLLTDLEFSLRATALATVKSDYGIENALRADRLRNQLATVQQTIHHPQLQRALDAVETLQLRLNNRANIESAADSLSQIAYEIADTETGASFGAIDSLVPRERK
ncbi:MAG: cytochrome c family protein [Planctomycetales bacterium]|nr:cytochrome c family protein [Planctomycetales bacterium]